MDIDMAYPTIQNSYSTTGNSTFNSGSGNWDFTLSSVMVSSLSQVLMVIFIQNINFDYVNNASWGSQSFTFLPGFGGGGLYSSIGYLVPSSSATNDVIMTWTHSGGGQNIGVDVSIFNGAPLFSSSITSAYNFNTSVSQSLTTTQDNSLVIAMSGSSESSSQTLGGGQTGINALNIGGASSYTSYKQVSTSGTNTSMSASTSGSTDLNISLIEIISVAPTVPSNFFSVL